MLFVYAQTNHLNMRLLSKRTLRIDASKYPDVASQIESWYRVVTSANWQNLIEVQQVYPSAESVGNFTVFNIKGNSYRLIVDINYTEQKVYYKYFLTHAEYDKGEWKNDPYF